MSDPRTVATPVLEVEIDKLGCVMCRFESAGRRGPLVGQDASGGGSWRGIMNRLGRAALLSEARCELVVRVTRSAVECSAQIRIEGREIDSQQGELVAGQREGKDVEGKDTFFVNKAGERMWWALERAELEWKGRKIGGDRVRCTERWATVVVRSGWTECLTGRLMVWLIDRTETGWAQLVDARGILLLTARSEAKLEGYGFKLDQSQQW